MTIQDLRRIVLGSESSAADSEAETELQRLKELMRQKKFWLGDSKAHEEVRRRSNSNCCGWHILGGPLRESDGFEMPVLPYQRTLLNVLSDKKALCLKKSRGIGGSTFMIYWALYRVLHDLKPGNRVIFTVGSRIQLAEDILSRCKRVFARKYPKIYNQLLQQSTTKAVIDGVIIEAFPSHSVSLRGYDQLKILVIEECDFYKKEEAKQIRAAAEGFIGKPSSDPHIILLSSPNAPNGILETIEKEKDSLYWFMSLTYEYGLEGPHPIYSQEQLARARKSPDWRREYCGEYLGQIGDVVSPLALSRCLSLGKEMDATAPVDDWTIPTQYVMGVDPGYGSSNTAVTVCRFVNGKIQVVYSKEFSRPVIFQDVVNEIWRLKNKCNGNLKNILIDASATEMYTALCTEFNQNPSLSYLQEKQAMVKSMGRYGRLERHLFVVPIAFSNRHEDLLSHLKRIVEDVDEDGKAMIAIDEDRFREVATALRTAKSVGNVLNKQDTVNDDTLDSLRLALYYFRYEDR